MNGTCKSQEQIDEIIPYITIDLAIMYLYFDELSFSENPFKVAIHPYFYLLNSMVA
jgi:hypothetical protein